MASKGRKVKRRPRPGKGAIFYTMKLPATQVGLIRAIAARRGVTASRVVKDIFHEIVSQNPDDPPPQTCSLWHHPHLDTDGF